ncbi:ABC-2 type transport system permease protein [Deinobacterium chartae]|uniref:Transport permease protein n=1 Tax=Deinobacterium chartae TaxID=521158 RepID=A0A841I3T0_9DEIO|nr:ABC transporter permease [Deinobacterium chartae]MBB6099973.1 ABC-2 type transport system permease protein [Deinobacterium chartae]
MTDLTLTRSRTASSLGAWTWLVRCELLKLMRMPAFVVPILLFPIVLFAMFGLPNASRELGGIDAGAYMLVSFSAYSLITVALFSFGVPLATERGLGWMRLLRVTPLSLPVYFAARVSVTVIIGLISVLLLMVFARWIGGISVPLPTLLSVLLKLLLGMLPFAALGLWIGYAAGPNSASGIANLIYLPLSFASGLFVPLQVAPRFVQEIAPYLPAYHFAQLGWSALGARGDQSEALHWLWLAGYTAVFLALAVMAYRRDQGQQFG